VSTENQTDKTETYELVPESEPFQEGFNKRTIVAAFFVGLVMMPGSIYLGLVTGRSLAGGAEWVTIILFIEIAKRSFVRLKSQEIIILYWVSTGLAASAAGVALFGGPLGTFIWNQFFLQSPMAEGIREYIPDWVVPSVSSDAIINRNFLHGDMVKPLLLIVFIAVFSRLSSVSMGYILFRITNDIEKLPFPMASVQAGGVTALAETSGKREGWRWRVFSTGTFIGAIFGMVYIVVPTLSSILLTRPVTLLPIPFVDFTPSIKSYLTATILGINTNLVMFFTGFVLPFWSVVGMFAGSTIVTFLVNPSLYRAGILHTWQPGMATIPTTIANTVDFWLSFNIGPAIWIALIGIIFVARAFIQSRSKKGVFQTETGEVVKRSVRTDRGDIALIWPIFFWVIGTVAFVFMVHILAPGFPWWISALFGFVWAPLMSYITARMIGITGSPQAVGIPYLKEATIYMTGYKGAAIWFAPIPMYNYGRTVNAFKQLELVHCKFGSYIKMVALSTTLVLLCSAFYWQMIWRMGKIPSAAYPFAQKMWPLHATMRSIWIKSTVPKRLSLFSFELPGEGRYQTNGLDAEIADSHGIRETPKSLKLALPQGGNEGSIVFTGFKKDWAIMTGGKRKPVRNFEFYVTNTAEDKLELDMQIASRSKEGKLETVDQKVELLPGLNCVAGLLNKDDDLKKIRSDFRRQIPPRHDNAKVSYFMWINKEGEQLVNLNAVESLTLKFKNPSSGPAGLYLDCISLLAPAEIFIKGIIKLPIILIGLAVAALAYAILKTMGAPTPLFYGLMAGSYTWPHNIIPMFVGAMVGRYVIMPRLGKKKWRTYAPILLAGYSCGSALIGMTSIAIVLIAKSVSPLIF